MKNAIDISHQARISKNSTKSARSQIAEVNFAQERDRIRFDVEQYYLQLQSNLDNVQTSTVALDQANTSS
jgi:outer membrane protein TolC